MAYLTNKMQDSNSDLHAIGAWFVENWGKMGILALISQFINHFFKWLTKRSEARIKEIYKEQYETTVKPEITALTNSINELKESIWHLKDRIK